LPKGHTKRYRWGVNRARRRVRAWATVWLVCQLAAVSAFVPRDCCAAHRPAAMAPQSQTGHGSHEGHGAHGGHQPVGHDDQDCVMRGVCNGPLDAIATLFMGPGLPLQPFTLLDTTTAGAGPPAADASALDSLRLPSTPPPRV
jgi:hypothetical protein